MEVACGKNIYTLKKTFWRYIHSLQHFVKFVLGWCFLNESYKWVFKVLRLTHFYLFYVVVFGAAFQLEKNHCCCLFPHMEHLAGVHPPACMTDDRFGISHRRHAANHPTPKFPRLSKTATSPHPLKCNVCCDCRVIRWLICTLWTWSRPFSLT